ncbi:MAG: hypothetical protein ACRDJT_16425 [Actinomycetota bacterium]
MKATIYGVQESRVTREVIPEPDWKKFSSYDGKTLVLVDLVELRSVRNAELQMVRIRRDGHFVMHSSPDVAFCQIVAGRGSLILPGNQIVGYNAPELYVFMPGSLHEWSDIQEDTLLSVCLVRQT